MTARDWTGRALGLLGLAGLAAVGVSAWGSKRWAGRVAGWTSSLESARQIEAPKTLLTAPLPKLMPVPPTHYDAREIEGLPAPVQRYFRAVLQDGQPIVTAVTIKMAGRINMSATGEQWKPFTSTQRVVTAAGGRRSGFIWNAKIAMLPGIKAHVVDSYIAGQGRVQAAVLGLFTVADMASEDGDAGASEMARGEFMRFFAETPWYPTALLPSQGVQWAAVDDTSANATLTDGPLSLTLLFHFNAAGLIDSVRAEARGGMVGKEMLMRPWECGLSNYQVQGGLTVPMSVPMTGEAAWVRPAGRAEYFTGTVQSMAFEFAP